MIISEQTVNQTINASPEAAWDVVGGVKDVDKWFAPMITSCRVEGNTRICGTPDGEFQESIDLVDHESRSFHYSIPEQHMMPVKNIAGTMKVTEAENGNANINWHWKFEVEEGKEAEAKEMLSDAGAMGITGIENYIKSMAQTV